MAPGKPLTELEKAYICKFYDMDGNKSIAAALDRSPHMVRNARNRIKNKGQYEYYQRMWDRQFKQVEYSLWF